METSRRPCWQYIRKCLYCMAIAINVPNFMLVLKMLNLPKILSYASEIVYSNRVR